MRQQSEAKVGSLVAALLGLCLTLTSGVAAQPTTWTLRIQDGVVTVNGGVVSRDRLPASVDTRHNIQMTWSGTDAPVVTMGDRYYMLERNGLRELSPAEIERHGVPSVSLTGSSFFRTDPTPANEALVRQLNELVADLDKPEAAERMAIREGAIQAAQTAAALPHLELQNYWLGVRAENQQLFEDYLLEQRLDLEARELAGALLSLPTGNDRARLETELRNVLNQLFDLKQKNREREIAQLEGRLDELQRVLDERNAKREQIIDRRFKELIGARY